MAITSAHIVSLSIVLLLSLLINSYAGRNIRSAEDFSLGGRLSGPAIVSGAILGAIVGGAATMGTAQLAFCVGLSAWWFTLGSGIGLICLAAFYAKPLRSSGLSTLPEFLVRHYGDKTGPLATLVSSIGIFFSISASMLSAFSLFEAILGVSAQAAAGITMLIVIIFVCCGGLKGAGISGLFKISLLYLTLFAAGAAAFLALGGFAGIQRSFPAEPWLSLFGRGVWTDLRNVTSLIIGIISTQTYAQAIFSARDTRTAIVGSLTAAALTIPVGLPSVAIGFYMRAHYPELLPIHALPMYLLNFVPAWIGGAAIAALLLSAIGSIVGLTLGVGTMLSNDLCKLLPGAGATKKQLLLNRSCVVLIAVAAAAFVLKNLDALVLDWNFLSMALRGTSVFIPLTLAVFSPGKLRPRPALYAMLAGIVTALGWTFMVPEAGNPLFPGLAASLAAVVIGIVLTPRPGMD